MIVVTGMHRSGTSFVCQLLSSLGVDFGDPDLFLQADDWNAAGYFEARDVLDANSRLVSGFPRTLGSVRRTLSQIAYLRMPSLPAIRRRVGRLAGELDALGAHYAAMGVKDPRFCLTLPIWREHADVSHVVVGVRHPTSVVRSLHRRQSIPLRLGMRFWAYHIDALLRNVPPDEGFFVQFETLRSEAAPEVASRLAAHLDLGVSGADVERALGATLRRDLVHHDREPHESLGAEIDGLWEQLQQRVRASCGAAAA